MCVSSTYFAIQFGCVAIQDCASFLFLFYYSSKDISLCLSLTTWTLPAQVWSLLHWMWRFLCGRQVSPPLWRPETNWWKSSKTNWKMTHRGEAWCVCHKHTHTHTGTTSLSSILCPSLVCRQTVFILPLLSKTFPVEVSSRNTSGFSNKDCSCSLKGHF